MVAYKYCANGNDFLIFHSFIKKNRQELARSICNRFSGIGADGLVVLIPNDKYAYEWEFYNSDGSYASMCGNASRCVAHYAYSLGLAEQNHSFLSGAGEIAVQVQGDIVTSNLGKYHSLKPLGKISLYEWYYIDTGVPHIVAFVDSKEEIPERKTTLMQELRNEFDANVNFAYKIDSARIQVCTYERGVEDITLACGTGMAACFAIGNLYYGVKEKAMLIPPSGECVELMIHNGSISLKGKVKRVGICVLQEEHAI